MSEAAARPRRHQVEDVLVAGVLLAMAVLPVLAIPGRWLRLPSTIDLVQQLTLWIGLLGGALAAREGKNLALSPLAEKLEGGWGRAARIAAALAAGVVAATVAWATVPFLRESLMLEPTRISGVPSWVWALGMPIGFTLVAWRETLRGASSLRGRALMVVGVAAVIAFVHFTPAWRTSLVLPGIALLGAATVLGAPIYALLGGVALLLFWGAETPLAALPAETHRLVLSPTLPALPLFTLAGYALAEGGASRRMVRVFRALFGWLPGGLAIATAVVCAFFTTFTGGSGVTILALGGLLLPALLASGYRERYSLGLVTASGSLGLLFPPSLPVILFSIVASNLQADVPIEKLFAGAFLPGCVLLLAVAITGVREGVESGAGRSRFTWGEARAAVWEAKWELALPLLVLFGVFGGFATLVEAAAATACYAILIEVLVYRDLSPGRGLLQVLTHTAIVVGGVLLILSVAQGLSSYLVQAEVPAQGAAWVRGHIETRAGFLLALNLFLLVVGCLMDIFSAILVVVPILLPIAQSYGVDPVHLGVIFLANLELGFLTPPVGLNLFLASYRFERPMPEVVRAVLPFLFLLLGAVVLITYAPWLTMAGVGLLEKWRP